MYITLLILIIQCFWFIHRFKSGKISLPHNICINSADSAPNFSLFHYSVDRLPTSPGHSTVLLPVNDNGKPIWFTRRNFNFLFPSFLHFKAQNQKISVGTNNEPAITTTKNQTNRLRKRQPSQRTVLLRAVSEPNQRISSPEVEVKSSTEVSIAPLHVDHMDSLITSAPLSVHVSEGTEFKVNAPIAQQEHFTELTSDKQMCVKGKESHDLTVTAMKKRDERSVAQQPTDIMKIEYESLAPNTRITSVSQSKKRNHKNYGFMHKSKTSGRASISMVCRLGFFLLHALFALLLITGDVGLYHLMRYYHQMNLDDTDGLRTINCRSAPEITTSSSSLTFSSHSTPSSLVSVTQTECTGKPVDSESDSPLIDGGVEVQVIGRQVKVPFELHIQTRGCLVGPVRPESSPLLGTVIIFSYLIIFFGIVGMHNLNINYICEYVSCYFIITSLVQLTPDW